MQNDTPMFPGGSSLSEEQESLLAMFLEKDDFTLERKDEKAPVIILDTMKEYDGGAMPAGATPAGSAPAS